MNAEESRTATELLRRVGFTITSATLHRLDRFFHESNGRLVMVMSHSCWQDYYLGLLLFKSGSIPITMFMNMKHRIRRWIARKQGMILGEKGISNSRASIEALNKKDRFGFLIALDRTKTGPKKVHSGYFHIAQATKAYVCALGFDYVRSEAVLSQDCWYIPQDETYEHFKVRGEPSILATIQTIHPYKHYFQVGFDRELYLRNLPANAPRRHPVAPSQMLLIWMCCNQAWDKKGDDHPSLGAVVIGIFIATGVVFLLLWLLVRLAKKKRTGVNI